jgi:hypothetical protein
MGWQAQRSIAMWGCDMQLADLLFWISLFAMLPAFVYIAKRPRRKGC